MSVRSHLNVSRSHEGRSPVGETRSSRPILKRGSILSTLLLLLLTSCIGTDVGNPVIGVDYLLVASSTDPQGGTLTTTDGLVVTSAWVAVERIRLRHAADCEAPTQTEILGPFAVDLLAPGKPAALEALRVPGSDYCRFEFRWDAFDLAIDPNAPDELIDASMVIAGRRADGTPFVLRSKRSDELRLDAVAGAFPIDDQTHALFVTFDLDALLTGVALESAVVNLDGVIRIEVGSNDSLLDAFEANLVATTRLFDDDDASGELDPIERVASEALAQ